METLSLPRLLHCQQASSAVEVQIQCKHLPWQEKTGHQWCKWEAQSDLQASYAVIWCACRIMAGIVLVPVIMMLSWEIVIVLVIKHPLL